MGIRSDDIAGNVDPDQIDDAARSYQFCVHGFVEFHRHLKFAISNRHKSTIRIGIQVHSGRVLNNQIGLNADFSGNDYSAIDDLALEKSMQSVELYFNQWRDDLAEAIANRSVGWLRMSVSVDGGTVLGCAFSPTFVMKPT